MINSLKLTADSLKIGDFFVAVTNDNEEEFFGIRTLLVLGEKGSLWYTDLQTGILHTLNAKHVVDHLPTLFDLACRMNNSELQILETLDDAIKFFGE